jgi:hypothetical protein
LFAGSDTANLSARRIKPLKKSMKPLKSQHKGAAVGMKRFLGKIHGDVKRG